MSNIGPAVQSIETLEIPEQAGLDSIRVYWHNVAHGKGYVTITCYGCAWNSWFGATGTDKIQTFFALADTSYLVTRLGSTQFLKQTTHHLKYFARIVDAVKAALKADGK